MALERLSPPAHLAELSPAGTKRWSRTLSRAIDDAITGPDDPTAAPRPQFFNPTKVALGDDAVEKGIFWIASPRRLRAVTSSDRERWRLADSERDQQDEYCEWAVRRNDEGKVTSVTFTCEVPEYFDALATDDRKQLLRLYRELAGPDVQLEDLFDAEGKYDRRNKWNSRTDLGPVHLIQQNNNLGAAVELAAAATLVRVIDGRTLTSEQELIACAKYGDGRRNSDPHIGAGVNALARQGADVSVADPPALYISDFTPAGWVTPDRTDAKTFWSYTRGEKDRRLRGVYEVPAEKPYVVGDITIRGRPIEFGAQIADFVSIKIVGVACRFGASKIAPLTRCADG